jgi:hypothetical protein
MLNNSAEARLHLPTVGQWPQHPHHEGVHSPHCVMRS